MVGRRPHAPEIAVAEVAYLPRAHAPEIAVAEVAYLPRAHAPEIAVADLPRAHAPEIAVAEPRTHAARFVALTFAVAAEIAVGRRQHAAAIAVAEVAALTFAVAAEIAVGRQEKIQLDKHCPGLIGEAHSQNGG